MGEYKHEWGLDETPQEFAEREMRKIENNRVTTEDIHKQLEKEIPRAIAVRDARRKKKEE